MISKAKKLLTELEIFGAGRATGSVGEVLLEDGANGAVGGPEARALDQGAVGTRGMIAGLAGNVARRPRAITRSRTGSGEANRR